MRRFTALFRELDQTTRTSVRLAALEHYFRTAPPADAAWALYFLSGRRLRRALPARRLLEWAAESAALPLWLAEESYNAVGDLAETVALLLPAPAEPTDAPLHRVVAEFVEPLAAEPEPARRVRIERAWTCMDADQRLVFHKLITGSFRAGVAAALVSRALAAVAGVEPGIMAHRLMGNWRPAAADFERLLAGDGDDPAMDPARPYPFLLAHPLESPHTLGDAAAWQAEWKWDGIRAQLIRRAGTALLWSRGEELLTDRFPEISEAARTLPDGTVLDGEVLCWRDGAVLPFTVLQRRIGRKHVSAKLLAEAPAIFLAFDLLEERGADVRAAPLEQRRSALERIVAAAGMPALGASPVIEAADWDALGARRQESRGRGVEGLMLKRRDAAYGVGRNRGNWWKWKVEPFTMDAVLLYAQRGHGRRASLYTDYTFGVWDAGELVTVAKAYSGLTDAEIRRVDRFVRTHTTERFGPVRQVEPRLVFELAFEGIQRSPRHRAGLAVRFPRIARWREDKAPEDADTLAALHSLLAATGDAP